MYALLALLALGLLLAVHELGHLVAARLLGMKVPRFTLGFGPPLLSFRLPGTEVILASVPFGASAHVHGANPHAASDAPGGFGAQPPWKRMVVVLAGPLANLLLALGLLFGLYSAGTHVVVPMTVGTVQPGSAAARAQLLPGDRIVRVDGQQLGGWSAFVKVVADSPGRELTLDIVREAEARQVTVRPRADERGAGRIGVSQQYVFRPHPPGEALGQALAHARTVAGELLELGPRLARGPRAAESTSPVALVRQGSDAASSGLDSFIRVLVTVSLALALLTVLPVPALDGGRLVFLAIEVVRGRRLSVKVETLANLTGFLALVLLILGVAVLDVRRALPQAPPADGPPSAPSEAVGPGGHGAADAGTAPEDAGVTVPPARGP